MNNLFYSIPTLLLCAVGYYVSYRYYEKNNFALAVLLLMACGLALRIYAASDLFLHVWDERYHALVAKNLLHHPLTPTLYDKPILPYDYRGWTGNHIWVHKQPLSLWIIAASLWAFGVNEIALRLPSIIVSTLGIGLSYFIGRYFSSKKVGYLTAFFFSINGLIIELVAGRVATDHVDTFFSFFIELAIVLSILFAQRKKLIYNVLAGICIGAAILTKWLPALVVVPIWGLVFLDAQKRSVKGVVVHSLILAVCCLLVFLPWQLYIFKQFPLEAQWESSFNVKHLTEVIEERTGPFYYFFNKLRISYGELIYLPLLWFVWKVITDIANKKQLAVFIWIFVPLVVFSIAKTKMQAYILFISPALFLITAEFYFMLKEHRNNIKFRPYINVILFLLIALPIRYMIERVKPFERTERNPAWAVDLRTLNNRGISRGVLFNYCRPIEAMFYTNLTVYPTIPDRNKITELLADGYTVLVNDDGKIPADIKSMEAIQIEQLSCPL